MAFSITKPFVILCEGPADQIFFERLLNKQKIKGFDVPPHTHFGNKYHGWSGLGFMLRSLAGDPASYSKLSGVLIIADNATVTTFKDVCEKIAIDGPFVAPDRFIPPSKPNEVVKQPDGHPCLCIMLVPIGTLGALESICADSITKRKPWLATCVNEYLSCEKIMALNWRPEKRDKARLQCLIAALNEDDPNKGLAHLLHREPPLIPFTSQVFSPIVKEIRRFRNEAGRQ